MAWNYVVRDNAELVVSLRHITGDVCGRAMEVVCCSATGAETPAQPAYANALTRLWLPRLPRLLASIVAFDWVACRLDEPPGRHVVGDDIRFRVPVLVEPTSCSFHLRSKWGETPQLVVARHDASHANVEHDPDVITFLCEPPILDSDGNPRLASVAAAAIVNAFDFSIRNQLSLVAAQRNANPAILLSTSAGGGMSSGPGTLNVLGGGGGGMPILNSDIEIEQKMRREVMRTQRELLDFQRMRIQFARELGSQFAGAGTATTTASERDVTQRTAALPDGTVPHAASESREPDELPTLRHLVRETTMSLIGMPVNMFSNAASNPLQRSVHEMTYASTVGRLRNRLAQILSHILWVWAAREPTLFQSMFGRAFAESDTIDVRLLGDVRLTLDEVLMVQERGLVRPELVHYILQNTYSVPAEFFITTPPPPPSSDPTNDNDGDNDSDSDTSSSSSSSSSSDEPPRKRQRTEESEDPPKEKKQQRKAP